MKLTSKTIILMIKEELKNQHEGSWASTYSPEEQAAMDWEREQAAGDADWKASFLKEALTPWLREYAPEEHPEWATEGQVEGPVPPEIRQQQIKIIESALAKVLEKLDSAELHLLGIE